MMSRKDTVVRARTDPDTTMPEQRSRKKIHLGQRDEGEEPHDVCCYPSVMN